jgi:hypothetical protein
MLTAMFGNRSTARSAAIEDSRQLGALASVLAVPEKIALLESGKNVAEIDRLTQPMDQRLRSGLSQVREIQSDLLAGIAEQAPGPPVAEPLVDLANRNQRSAARIAEQLHAIATGRGERE